jgi:hypothetical protein
LFLRRSFFLLVCACVLVIAGASVVIGQDEVSDLFGRINALRASVGRASYSLNGALSAAAQSQAQWMVDTGTIAHARPDGSTPRSRAINAGYSSAMVSENIYGGSNASASVAWNFWINSAIHYAGLTSANYSEVGIGIAGGGWGRAYVLVFGNPGGVYTASSSSSGGGGNTSARAAPQRIYAIGVDAAGNIQHLIATGDTLGDIALIYGYTWDDIPGMMALNSMSDPRVLLPGEIFLVPPQSGTYTPTPGGPTETPIPTATPLPPTITPFVAARATSAIPTANVQSAATIGGTAQVDESVLATMRVSELPARETAFAPSATPSVSDTPAVIAVAAVNTLTPDAGLIAGSPPSEAPRGNSSMWIGIALVVQIGIIALAGFEFARRRLAQRASREIGQITKRGRR